MPLHPKNESELLEAISEAENPSEILRAAFDAIDDAIDALLKTIFHKDDVLEKFVVNSLLKTDGPLGEIMVRAKLLLGLGMICKETYHDIDIFTSLKKWANIQENDVDFIDKDIIFELNKIHAIKQICPIVFDENSVDDMTDLTRGIIFAHHTERVRSTIGLAVLNIVKKINKTTP